MLASSSNPFIERIIVEHPKLAPGSDKMALLAKAVFHANDEWRIRNLRAEQEFEKRLELTKEKDPELVARTKDAIACLKRLANRQALIWCCNSFGFYLIAVTIVFFTSELVFSGSELQKVFKQQAF